MVEKIEPIRAAQYVRMSTEHQQYSTANQDDTIREYAHKRGFTIVRTYADEGKSGLSLSGRASLQKMIEDVESGQVDYSVILVYDISRWGRFQDADESAYYEYLCKRAGIEVHYCAEQFENDGGPTSTIIKSVKRAMAGEYSRELSNKVFKGQCRLIELGYRQGGPAGYGLRRMMINQAGDSKGTLARGERKSLQTDRVILIPGPEQEVETVKWIYKRFTVDGKRESEIASELNERGILTDLGRHWNRGTVNQILTNEKYVGINVFNRTSFKLKKKRVANPSSMWVKKEQAFTPIVELQDFFIAQGIIQERARRISNETMLEQLKSLARNHTSLSGKLIDDCESMPSSAAYRTRFGSLLSAYKQIGWATGRDYSYVDVNQSLKRMHPGLVGEVVSMLDSVGATVTHTESSDTLLINGEYSATLVLSRCRQSHSGAMRWVVNLNRELIPDITILVRMNQQNDRPSDFYLLPIIDIASPKLLLCETNGSFLDTYQFPSLDYFASLSTRTTLEI